MTTDSSSPRDIPRGRFAFKNPKIVFRGKEQIDAGPTNNLFHSYALTIVITDGDKEKIKEQAIDFEKFTFARMKALEKARKQETEEREADND